ncbi:Imm1 family immunity protein [Streptomyces griseus]|uniref:Imm1 family immunity protein n=1 Tax=Streptomyces griseus TaxID=1911 RepID=UPI0036736FB2
MGSEARMTLKTLGDNPLYLKTRSEVRDYLDGIFADGIRLKSYTDLAFQVIRDVAVGETDGSAPDNVLSVGIDFSSGYSGFIWYCDGGLAHRVSAEFGHDIAYHPWVSMNPNPPQSDPKVLSDPSCPTFFDRVSVMPLSSIRPVVEEYFNEGTGFRPAQIQWVKGHYTGELYVEDSEA